MKTQEDSLFGKWLTLLQPLNPHKKKINQVKKEKKLDIVSGDKSWDNSQ